MKKERIAGLCICVLLWGSFQSVCFTAVHMKILGAPDCSWAAVTNPQVAFRPGLVSALMYAGWPQLGFLRAEIYLLKRKDAQAREAMKPAGKNLAYYEKLEQWFEYGIVRGSEHFVDLYNHSRR